jgi:diguanylate cyclase (GGDEF)-like protein/PAS domain S-box-containing protein
VTPAIGDRRYARRLGFALALALLACVAGIAYERLAQLRIDTEWNDHTHAVIEAVEKTRVALLAAESMRRSYRISLDPADRDLMEARVAETERDLDETARLTADNPSQQARLASLRPIVRERVSILREGLALPRWEQLPQATRDEQRAIQGRGTALAKEVRDVFDAMLAEEARLLGEREAHALATARSARIAIVGGGAVGLCLVGAFYVSLERENRRRMLAQAALERSTLLVSAVVEGTSDIIVVKDREGRYLLANGAAASYLQRRPEEILGRTDAELMSPEAAATVRASDREILDAGEARVLEQHLVNGGEPRTFLSTKAPYRDAAGGILGVISVSRDITERKLLELKVAEQAVRDPLTGLFNRGYMDETLAREISRARRRDAPVSVVMIDLDHFKRLNDTHGHAAGDAVLKRFAELLRGSVRREDVACRYGGEEFAVILPEMTPEKARERAESLRATVEQMQVDLGETTLGSVSASLGVAGFPAHGATGAGVLAAADAALYRAKGEGRNRVVMGESADRTAADRERDGDQRLSGG